MHLLKCFRDAFMGHDWVDQLIMTLLHYWSVFASQLEDSQYRTSSTFCSFDSEVDVHKAFHIEELQDSTSQQLYRGQYLEWSPVQDTLGCHSMSKSLRWPCSLGLPVWTNQNLLSLCIPNDLRAHSLASSLYILLHSYANSVEPLLAVLHRNMLFFLKISDLSWDGKIIHHRLGSPWQNKV